MDGEISGRRKHKLPTPDAPKRNFTDDKLVCRQCQDDGGMSIEADGYCVTCKHFLCGQCYTAHRKPLPMREHRLLNKQQMPNETLPPDDTCLVHPGHALEQYCILDDACLCSTCYISLHHNCKGVLRITDISDEIEKSEEFTNMQTSILDLEHEVNGMTEIVSKKISDIDDIKMKVKSEFSDFRDDLKAHIDKLETDMYQTIEQISANDKQMVQNLETEIKSIREDTKSVMKDISLVQKYKTNSDLFTKIKLSIKKIKIIQERLQKIQEMRPTNHYCFVREPRLQAIVDQIQVLGEISIVTVTKGNNKANKSDATSGRMIGDKEHIRVSQQDNTLTHATSGSTDTTHGPSPGAGASERQQISTGLKDNEDTQNAMELISIKPKFTPQRTHQEREHAPFEQDNKDTISLQATTHAPQVPKTKLKKNVKATLPSDQLLCRITGLAALPDNKLVLIDNDNTMIKLFDANKQTIVSHISEDGYPYDITALSHDKLAVTKIEAGKIQFVRVTGDRLSTEGHLQVSRGCRGIACHENKLYVGYSGEPAQVQVLDLQGQVLQTFILETAGQPLCDSPEYITVSSDGIIYVSDSVKEALICLDPQGQVLWRYTDTDMKCPRGVVVNKHGTVYVAGSSSNNIHVVSSAGSKLHKLQQADLQDPNCLAFSDDEKRLYIGMMRSDNDICMHKNRHSDAPKKPCRVM